MTQRIFDIENEKDMQDLWDILPDWADKITKREKENEYDIIRNIAFDAGHRCLIKINWQDATEITRPVSMVGCVGWFWDSCGDEIKLGILIKTAPNDEEGYCFLKDNDVWYKNFRPAKKSELKFWEDKNE